MTRWTPLHMCLTAFTPMLDTMRVLPENMRKAAAGGFINATDCADYLVSKGMPFRDAYQDHRARWWPAALTAARRWKRCRSKNTNMHSELFDEGVYDAISLERCVERAKGPRRALQARMCCGKRPACAASWNRMRKNKRDCINIRKDA